MTTADAVRRWLGPGRLLALGGAEDGVWITERAARAVLERAGAGVTGVVPGPLRLDLADPEAAARPRVPPPPGALPPGPLRITAECTATTWSRPLPELAAGLREALLTAATDVLDLPVTDTDIRVTGLADPAPAGGTGPVRAPVEPSVPRTEPDGPAARAAAAVPGVDGLTATLGPAVTIAPDRARLEIAVARGHRPLTVARAVRSAVSPELPGDLPVAVLITAVTV
ncbi:hypothetical protein I3J09_23050 [Streptomyces clavuligerus]|uniref:hypothetical protein n=1 Tax=Streptomyces clavuligerus TaxID=1901 RepID=UPI00020D93D8|nr:hypothetical protein [Streptomyces clavuligerus]ANW20828.1 hypothetical protein BB341_22745 [Streptomyces clavuligerus]MBY6305548.1 hypothetical protein [Streptomyces clavuligerus]QPL65448.1 hypothetical protein I3J04_23035 [Streptomyces clavuligerus]QPL71479.1 hypothetical protein I3J05_23045 [Streptomyces clavuligerus]QPL77561.1 hypothetical protein I3J06_23050 [Streptomyces clavuligerus]